MEHLDRSIAQYESDIAVIKEKHEKLQSVARLRQNILGYKNELDWLKVATVERDLVEVQKQLAKKREQIAKIQDLVKNKSKLDKELKDKVCSFGAEFNRLTTVVNEKDEFSEKCRLEFEKIKDELSGVEQIQRNLNERKGLVEQNVNQLQLDIDERENNPLNVDNMRKENEAKIQGLEKKKEDLALILANARRDHGQFTDTLNDYRERIDEAKKQQIACQNELQNCTGQIQKLQGSTKDALAVYGHPMSQMIKRIEQLHKQKKFTELPRGPLGRYIEVPDKKYKSAVENILDQSLTSFYVCCDKDRILMSQVLKDFPDLARTPIITGAFHHQVYDVRNGMAQINSDDGRRLMDVIKVSDPVVMNCLIDQRHIEEIVLVDSTEVAIGMTQDLENVPQNLLRAVLLKPFSEFYPAPNYRSYATREKPVRFIQTNTSEFIAVLDEKRKTVEDKLRQINELVKRHQLKVREQEKLVTDKKRLMNELQQKERNYTQELDELKSVEYPDEKEGDYLRGELEELKKKQRHLTKKINECGEKVKALQETVAQKEIELKKCREEARGARNRMTVMQQEMEATDQQIKEMSVDFKSKTNQIAALKSEENELVGGWAILNGKVDSLIGEIQGERVETDRPEDTVQHLIRSAEKRIKNIESHNDNIEDVELLLKNKIQQVEKMMKVREVLDQVLKTVRN